jgi:hypothetical protein
VFSSWDDDLNEGLLKLSETTTPIILSSAYEITGSTITDATITTTSDKVAESEGNVATISFTPITGIPIASGLI